MKPKSETLDQATDRLFLQGDEEWAHYPLLPVKNTKERDASGFPLLGVLLAKDTQNVYLTNIWALDKLDECEKRTYTDREAMILAGWVVD